MATSTLIEIFEPTLQKTHEWLDQIQRLAKLDDERQAYSLTRATLHALRDRLTVGEATDLASQLPLMLKGVYYDGWKPSKTPTPIRSLDGFVEQVRRELPDNFAHDIPAAIGEVFAVIDEHVTEGEVDDVRQMLPEEVRQLWPE